MKYIFILFFSNILLSQTTIKSFEDCIKIIDENNYQVQNLILDSLKTSLKISEAKNSFLPTASFILTDNYDFGTAINPSTNIRESRNRYNVKSNISVDWIFFEGFKRKYNVNIQELNHLITLEDSKKKKRDIYLKVLEIYSNIILNREALDTEYLILERNNEIEKYVNEKINRGFELKINYKSLETKKLRNEINIRKINNEYKFLLIKLKGFLNIKDEIIIENTQNLFNTEILEKDFKKTKKYFFPELNEIFYETEIERNKINIIKGNYYPKISLKYNFNSFYTHILGEEDKLINNGKIIENNNNFFKQFNNNKSHYLGISIILPLFNQFNNKINVQISKIELKRKENVYNQRKIDLENQIELINKEIENLIEEFNYQAKYLEELKELLSINNEKYNLGILSLYELYDFLSTLEIEEKKLIQIKLEYYYKLKILDIYSIISMS